MDNSGALSTNCFQIFSSITMSALHTDLQIFKMRVKVRNTEDLNSISASEIFSHTKDVGGELIKDESTKESITMYNPTMQSDNVDDDVPALNVEQSENIIPQLCEDKNTSHKKTHSFAKIDNASIQDKIQIMVEKTVNNMNKKVNKVNKKTNRLQLSNQSAIKKESLKKVSNSGKIIKRKVSKKSDKVPSKILNEELIILGKQFETEEYYKKSTLPAFTFTFPNNTMFHENMYPCYGVTKQQELQHYGLDNNRSPLQYIDYNTRYAVNSEINLQSNPWLMASKNVQGSALNNITEMKQNEEQSSFNDKQSYMYSAVDYNWKQYENPYLQSSVNSTYPFIYSVRNGDYCPYNNLYHYQNVYSNTSDPWNNIYSGAEAFPKTNVTFPQIVHHNNSTASHVSSTITSNNFLNTAIRPTSVPPHKYQLLQSGHEFKRSFHWNLNTVNYANNSGYEMISTVKENVISPFKTWHHANRPITPYNNNVNVPSTSITSDVPPSHSLYTDNANQYRQMDQCNEKRLLQAVPSFEDSITPIDTDKLNSDGFATLSYQNNLPLSTDNDVMSDITNFLSETEITEHEKSSSSAYTKKEDWISYVFDSIYKDIL